MDGIISIDAVISGEISGGSSVSGSVSSTQTVSGMVSSSRGPSPEYEGEYEVTPSADTQILETKYKYMVQDIVIDPIPNNYGLITWDGNVLTVS